MQNETQYLSQEKFDELQAELSQLKTTGRKEVAATLEYAVSLGDLSENAEYHEARDKQAGIEDRIKELDGQIEQYENNILFISRGKAGDSLREEIRKKIDLVKKDKGVLMEKLKVLKSVKEGQ
jgi:transcription elongation factor GreA